MPGSNEFRCAIEFRADDSRLTPGRLVGELLTYGKRALDRPEMFEVGAFHWDAGGVVLNRQHARTAPILRFTPIVDGDVVRIDVPLPDTTAGRDAAAEVRDGLMSSLSVEFKAEQEDRAGGLRVIRRARLTGAALVDEGSYGGEVSVRERDASAELAALRRQLPWL